MIFGRGTPQPTKINQAQLTQSVLGFNVPVVMGMGKIQQSLLWMDAFKATKVAINNGGGGKGAGGGGKGGSTQYVYSADVIAALCNGPVAYVADVWSNQSWLSNQGTAETYLITAGTPVYTPINASVMAADLGVSVVTTYSASFNDVGAGSPTALSGTDSVSFVRKTFGTTLNSGEYSIDSSNHYHFSASNAGQTITVHYSFALGLTKGQQIDVVPSPSHTIQIGTGTPPFAFDGGVIYYAGANAGQALTRVNALTGTAGHYTLTTGGGGVAFYQFEVPDIGADVLITYHMNNTAALPQGVPASLDFTLFEGFPNQSPWSLLSTTFPGASLGYNGLAYVAYGPMSLGYSGQVQQNIFEVLSFDYYGGGIVDCSPVQCILQVLTNSIWGLGSGAVPFPTSAIDNSAAGSWGFKTSSTSRMADSTAFSWFAANGFFISPVLDKQESAASIISKWLEAGMCAAFMSEGLMKLRPYGDTSTAGNGATWVAPSAFAAALDDTCFLGQDKQDPVKISCSPWQDAYNVVQVQWNNRSNQYAPEITPESDEAAINRYGKRIEDPLSWDFITTLPSATFAASMRVKRGVYTRNTYEFSLPFSYSELECMDVVTITTSSVWAAGLNNANLGIVNLPVRITKIVDNPGKEGLKITAEDYPFGVHQPTIYNKGLAAGQVNPNIFADPGNSEVIIFEATNRLTGFAGNEIWIGATGTSADWGSCNVHVSQDGVTYRQIGTIISPAKLGVLHSALGVDHSFHITTSGGTSSNKLLVNNGTSVNGQTYFMSVFINNTGAKSVVVNANGGTAVTVPPGAAMLANVQAVGNGSFPIILFIGAALSGDSIDFYAGTPSIALTSGGANTLTGGQLTYASWTVLSGSTFTATDTGTDPDRINQLVIDLVENSAALAAGTTTDADKDNTLCYVGGELLSTSAMSITGVDQYTAGTYIRRGRMGSSILSHVSGELFVRLDDALFKFTYDPTWAGQTIHLKFQSVNVYGNSAQPLSLLTAINFTIPGLNPGTIDASSGLVLSAPFLGAGPLGWVSVA